MFDFGSQFLHPGTQVEADAPNLNSRNHGELQYQEFDMDDEQTSHWEWEIIVMVVFVQE